MVNVISEPAGDDPHSSFAEAQKTLQARVNAAAEALLERGLKPTVTRVRAAMGGGSPNDIGPALKHWKEVLMPGLGRSVPAAESAAIPPIVSDVVRELWSRALAAASVEIRGGVAGRLEVSQGEQVHLLRQEVASLRDRLQRENQAYGELRGQSARHEVIAKDALSRAADLEARLQRALEDLGAAHGQIAELTASTHEPKPPKSAKRPTPKPCRKTRRSKPRQSAAVRSVKRSKPARVRPRKNRRR
jgi:Plasmid replication region DNA-binding N-term